MYRVYAIIILSVLLLASIGAGGYLYKEWRNEVKEKKSLIQLNGKSFKDVEIYKNKYGTEVIKNKVLELESSSIKQLYKDGQLESLKQFSGLKKNMKNLETLITLKAELTGKVSIPIDSNGVFSFDDSFNNIDGIIKGDTLVISDTTTIPLSIAVYWKRKWFLGKSTYSAEGYSENKRVKIIGLETIKVIKR